MAKLLTCADVGCLPSGISALASSSAAGDKIGDGGGVTTGANAASIFFAGISLHPVIFCTSPASNIAISLATCTPSASSLTTCSSVNPNDCNFAFSVASIVLTLSFFSFFISVDSSTGSEVISSVSIITSSDFFASSDDMIFSFAFFCCDELINIIISYENVKHD
ncbi:MAG: hypothetical protein Q8Q23_02500 [bacterium]|nr:hypothetical protein [bacterium]